MRAFQLVIRVLGVAFVGVAALHLCLGLQADALLGAPVSAAMAADPSFDAQNRFYGVCFSLLGVVLLVASTDLPRFAPMLDAALGVLLAAGVARSIAWALHGAPAPMLVVILVADLALPPVLYLWRTRVLTSPVRSAS